VTSGSSAGSAPDRRLALATLQGRLCGGPLAACANLSQRRIDDGEGPDRVIRAGPISTAATALAVAVSPLLGIEAPHAEQEADKDGASNQGQEEDWQRFLQ
jgi:hypothetical protein